MHSSITKIVALAAAFAVGASSAYAQRTNGESSRDTTSVVRMAPITITATRSEISTFRAPQPVQVVTRDRIAERLPNNVAELFREMPGIDMMGVGPNQGRPSIRGQRGQRILVLADGLRLNNSRRQQDFGELPGLVDVANIERVEVVRGPASVLYGSDAIGGVVNLITRVPSIEGLHGSATYRFSSHDAQHKGAANLFGRFGRFGFSASGSYRDANAYDAPSGSFGNITLANDVEVFDTGLQDENYTAYVSYDLASRQQLFAKFERYVADTAGFGFVEPSEFAAGSPRIQIRYPSQNFNKLSLGYDGRTLGLPIADHVSVTGYVQTNERRLNLNVFVPMPQVPGAGVDVVTQNFTDLETFGFRIENQKLVGAGYMLTYGVDYFRDRSDNTDSSTVTITGFGPPIVQNSDLALVPNASFRSLGVFVQAEVPVYPNWRFTLGGRYQDVHSATRETAGLMDPLVSQTDRTVVGAANVIYEATDQLNIIAGVGRAFRSPNLVERFFNGPTPEGGSFQVRNPDLEPETSLNLDFGARYRGGNFSLEAFVFRNEVSNGIIVEPTGNTIAGLPEFRNANSEKLRFMGIEFAGDVEPVSGLTLAGNFSFLDAENVEQPELPVGDTYRTKFMGTIRYDHTGDRFWAEYQVRHNGERDDVLLVNNPLGDVLPAFTVHAVRAGVTLFRMGGQVHRVGVVVSNLTDELYAEFANASFFRPEPKRSVTLTYGVSF